jgi:hypothetical protein
MFLPHNASSDLFSFFLFVIRPALDLLGGSSYDTPILRNRIDDPTAPLNTHTCQMDMGMHHVGRSRTLFIVAMTELCCSLLFLPIFLPNMC